MTNQQGAEALAHELYTAAQLAPGEGVLDAVARLAALVEAQQPAPSAAETAADILERIAEEPPINGNNLATARVLTAAQALRNKSPTPQADSQPAGVTVDDAIRIAKSIGVREYGPNTRNWSFEYSQLAQFVALLTAAAYVDADRAARAQADSVTAPAGDDFQPCPSCFGKGVDGDADDYGHTIDVTCGECNGSGRAAPTTKQEQ